MEAIRTSMTSRKERLGRKSTQDPGDQGETSWQTCIYTANDLYDACAPLFSFTRGHIRLL